MMPGPKNKYVFLTIACAVGAALLATYLHVRGAVSQPFQKSPTASTTHAGNVDVTASGGATIEVIPEKDAVAVPATRRPFVDKNNVPADALAVIKEKTQKLEGLVKADSKNTTAWIDLGTVREMIGDHEGAKQAWEYVIAIEPQNITAIFNLAALNADYLKMYSKAEVLYKRAISVSPKSLEAYRALFALYTNTAYRSGATAAEDILKQGIKASPDPFDLQVLLARYYKSVGRTADAKIQFDAAIASATRQGKTDIAAQIKTESTQ